MGKKEQRKRENREIEPVNTLATNIFAPSPKKTERMEKKETTTTTTKEKRQPS